MVEHSIPDPDQKTMHLLDHLKELRKRIIRCVLAIAAAGVIAFAFHDAVISLFTSPFVRLELPPGEPPLYLTSVTEGFVVRVKTSLIAGLIAALPVIIYQAIRFIFPGLKGRERRSVAISLVASFFLAAGGFYYGYFQIVPVSLEFLTSSSFVPERVGILLSYRTNIFFVLQFLMVTVVTFQLPVVMIVLMAVDVVNRKRAFAASRYVIVGAFVLSAILTPPEVVSQIAVAVPLVALYYIAIVVARIFGIGDP